MLNFVMDKKTESCVKKLIEEIFMYVSLPIWEKKLNPLTTNQKLQKLAVRLLMKPFIIEFLNVKLFNLLFSTTYFYNFFV